MQKQVIGVGIELAPIAIPIYQAMNSGNGQAVEYLKPQFYTKIKQLDTQVAHMKTNIDNNVAKLVNANNQAEYSKIYEPLQKDWQEYQQVKNIVNKVKFCFSILRQNRLRILKGFRLLISTRLWLLQQLHRTQLHRHLIFHSEPERFHLF